MTTKLTNMVANSVLRENAAYDYTLANFTRDGVWHDLDLSGILPSWATKFWCRVVIQASAGNKIFGLRKNGNTGESDFSYVPTHDAGKSNYRDTGPIGVDSNQVCEYYATNESGFTWNIMNMVIRAYE